MNRPLKRHPALQPLSREHHHILLLGFKIRQGLKNNIEPERIRKYCTWFFDYYLQPHFEKEEFHLTHLLESDSEITSRLQHNHQKVSDAFKEMKTFDIPIKVFELIVVSHVRFEERVLFEEIQNNLTDEDIQYLEKYLTEHKFQDDLQDVFWL